jgi:hypothetical protein
MAGIRGLKKGERPTREREAVKGIAQDEETERKAQTFIGGGKPASRPRKKRVYERYTFSLTPEVSDEIDELTLGWGEFRVNRSEVVKAGVEALKRLSREQRAEVLRKVKGRE